MMSVDLAKIGQALYGERWQSALARDLGVSDRTMRRWAAGTHEPPDLTVELLVLMLRRRADLTEIINLLS